MRENPGMSAFEQFLATHHHLTPDDVVPSSVPGYWDVLEACPGGSGCRAL